MPTKAKSGTTRSAATKRTRRAVKKKAVVVKKKAAVVKKRAVKSVTRGPDAIALIKADHKAVRELFRQYQGLGERATSGKRRIAQRLVKELSVHAAIEETVLYPFARKKLPGGPGLVSEAKREHQQLKRDLARLDKLEPTDRDFAAVMKRVRDEVRHHVKEEEAPEGILGLMRADIGRDDLKIMGAALRVAKKAAPTRPHPKAPPSAPANAVVGSVAAVFDRARDAAERRP